MNASEGHTSQFEKLLDRAAAGESDVYDDLIALASVRLQKLTAKMLRAYPHLKRWEQTDDVFQNAALKLHRSLSDVKPRSVGHFMALAATQIRRTLIDMARHHFGPEGQAAHHNTDPGNSTDQVAGEAITNNRPESLESWAEFHEAAQSLPDDERRVFDLLWYGGLEQQEVAACLEISLSTVKRRWRSARVSIHNALAGKSPLQSEQ